MDLVSISVEKRDGLEDEWANSILTGYGSDRIQL